ncbi:MAG: LacI family DNA-binding transcriptional regulator [Alphaproteobacteria bacterium]|nr:LacI family DNA-binding transcriptional regulator [Alphaproteobacteria bacterium]
MMRRTLEDVARAAGVSLATADRALNGRAGVREETRRRIEIAAKTLGYRPDRAAAALARAQHWRFCFILPRGDNIFMRQLADAVRETASWIAEERVDIELIHVDVFDGPVLARELALLGPRYDGFAIVALDHPAVRDAIDALADSGRQVVTLVSDAPTSRRHHYVGLANFAAGRTAGTLLGRFVGSRHGSVAVIAGSLALRDHAERVGGFTQALGEVAPHLRRAPIREGRDRVEETRAATEELLAAHADLVGLYLVGAAKSGAVTALERAGRAQDVVFIGHDLTPDARGYLLSGTMDAVINQDAGHEARSAARVLLARCEGRPINDAQERIRIDIFVKDNLP